MREFISYESNFDEYVEALESDPRFIGFTEADFASSDWQAKMQRHYPRTEAEVLANAAIPRRPRR